MVARDPRLNVGWATKIINEYLKKRAYIGAQGRHHLKEMIHPPIDAGLWRRLARDSKIGEISWITPTVLGRSRTSSITSVTGALLDGCRIAAKVLDRELIEVEQLWAGIAFVASD